MHSHKDSRVIFMQILLSGVQPSGNFHIGNYLGAIKQWVDLQKTHRVFAMIADLHAITIPQESDALRKNTLSVARILLACGMNPKKSVLFVQSQIPAHAELGWILNTITPLGELERMTQFKEKKEKAGVLAGLLNYPTLMAADILLYNTDVVPVGEDQIQHIELTRTLARKFNARFGETFKEPKEYVLRETSRVMALDDPIKKMSKSSVNPNSYIALLDEPEIIRKKIRTAVTDSGKEVSYDEAAKPAIANLMRIYSAFSGLSFKEIEVKFLGKGYGEFKRELADVVIAAMSPIQTRYRALTETSVKTVLKKGQKSATKIANATLTEAKKKTGFLAAYGE